MAPNGPTHEPDIITQEELDPALSKLRHKLMRFMLIIGMVTFMLVIGLFSLVFYKFSKQNIKDPFSDGAFIDLPALVSPFKLDDQAIILSDGLAQFRLARSCDQEAEFDLLYDYRHHKIIAMGNLMEITYPQEKQATTLKMAFYSLGEIGNLQRGNYWLFYDIKEQRLIAAIYWSN